MVSFFQLHMNIKTNKKMDFPYLIWQKGRLLHFSCVNWTLTNFVIFQILSKRKSWIAQTHKTSGESDIWCLLSSSKCETRTKGFLGLDDFTFDYDGEDDDYDYGKIVEGDVCWWQVWFQSLGKWSKVRLTPIYPDSASVGPERMTMHVEAEYDDDARIYI